MTLQNVLDDAVERFAASVYEAWQREEGPKDPIALLRSAEEYVEQVARSHGTEVVASARLDEVGVGGKLTVTWEAV